MPYAPHIRMTALGRLGAPGGERFSFGINLAKTTADLPDILPDLAPNQDVWEDLAEDVRAFFGDDAARINPRAVLEEVKFARIGTDGKYLSDPVIVNVADTAGGSAHLPAAREVITPQAACAVSLNTARRGPRGRGRFFLPMPTVNLVADTLQMTEVDRDSIQNRTAQLLNALNNQPGLDVLDLRVVVASSIAGNAAVTGVRVGRVVDTIRSRRRSISEQYDPITPVG